MGCPLQPALVNKLDGMMRISDGTGVLQLIFLGRRDLTGVIVGTRIAVEGRVSLEQGMPTIRNPNYRLMGSAI